MIEIRKSADRGHANHGWLDSFHTFSFADYFDPAQMGFGPLRVINEDRVSSEGGFGMHPHRDMEIISYVMSGELAHEDSMGNSSKISRGEVQRMSAGTGIRHSEYNPSSSGTVHFFQIWIIPEKNSLAPSYEQKRYADEDKLNRLLLIASHNGRENSLTIHQDASLYATILNPGKIIAHKILSGRLAYIHAIDGILNVNGIMLRGGDGAKISAEEGIILHAQTRSEALIFDLCQ